MTHPSDKSATYTRVAKEIAAVIDGETSSTARYATVACLLSEAFGSFFWTGFYVVDPLKPEQLVVGPYQGTLGCLRIPIGRGVCGVSAEKRQTVIVDDVHAFPGHIACDSRSNSEIVVPVFNDQGELAAVLDVDSTELGSFDEVDQAGLEAICATLLSGAKT
jgi:GAF domain-containing protein